MAMQDWFKIAFVAKHSVQAFCHLLTVMSFIIVCKLNT